MRAELSPLRRTIGPMAGELGKQVDAFVIAVAADLEALSGADYTADVTREAGNLVGALIMSDGRLTDSELRAWLDDIGPRLDPPVIVTPERLRSGGLLDGTRSWLDAPSTLFDLLVNADAGDGERRANRYYDHAMKLAHATAALDLVPSADELAAIDAFRMRLLRAMDDAGVPRPGQPTIAVRGERSAHMGAERSPLTAEADVAMPPARTLDDLLAELDELVGLEHVKAEVRRLTSLLRVQKIRAERDLPTIETSHHLVFTGNPGTGKTTVGRLLAQIYRTLGVVSKGHLVETDRSKLVAGYVGQTATRTRDTLESALGGMLLIDEAYALARGGENDFGREAIDTLVKFMEDHRDDLSIVVAGYPQEMQTLLEANPGLESRFTRTIHFPDYTTDELVEIFRRMGDKNKYHLDSEAGIALRALIDAEPRDRGFGNARFVRNVFESSIAHQAIRLADVENPDDTALTTLTAADVVGPG